MSDKIQVGGTMRAGGTITVEMIKEVAEKVRYVPRTKEQIFEKLFPNVEDCTDWELIIPDKFLEDDRIDFLKNFEWVKFTEYTELVLAFNPRTAWADL